MIRRIRSLRQCERGSALVEGALVLTVLLVLIIGIIEFSVAFFQWNTMLLAVEQAGRQVMVSLATPTPCNTTTCAETQMQNVLTTAATGCTNPGAGAMCVNATLVTVNGTNSMQLAAYYNFDFLAIAGRFTIAAGATVPLD